MTPTIRNAAIGTLGAVCVLAAAKMWLASASTPRASANAASAPPTTEAAPTPSTATGAPATLLQGALLSKLQEMNTRLAAIEERASATKAGPPDPALEAPPPTPQESHQRNLQRIETIDAAFAKEPVDGDWALATERQLADHWIGAQPPGNTLIEPARCRATFCRVVVRHADVNAQEGFVEFVAKESFGSYTVPKNPLEPGNTAPLETVAYLIRNSNDSTEHPVRVAANARVDAKSL